MRNSCLCSAALFGALASAGAIMAATPTDSPGLESVGEVAVIDESDEARVQRLIQQLGAPKYVERHAAMEQLRSVGLRAFEPVLSATTHPDPEVAAACEHLVGELTAQWVRGDDPPEVQRELSDYALLDDADRQDVVRRLAARPERRGWPALVRIARFDRSPLVSRLAAAAVLRWDQLELPDEAAGELAQIVDRTNRQAGPSNRPAAQWLSAAIVEGQEPKDAIAQWREAIGAENRLLTQRDGATSETILSELYWRLLRAQVLSDDAPAASDTASELIELSAAEPESILSQSLDWFASAEAWGAVDKLLADEQDVLRTKMGKYLAADVRVRQGREDAANELSQQAFETPTAQEDDIRFGGELWIDARVIVGQRLELKGRTEWAINEYRAAAAAAPADSSSGAYARWMLADLLQDNQRYVEAAEALAEMSEAVNRSNEAKQRYSQLVESLPLTLQLPPPEMLVAREAYYRALHHRQEGDSEKVRELLHKAIEADPTDADVVIAMYRAAGQDEVWREETREHIQRLERQFQQQINEYPDEATPYNQWAWLISNTEGDYQQAVEYSKKSLQLRPGSASFLDTLGRCYYAAGELEKAIETQREAIELQPNMQVMQRQLELFERELAAR